MYLDSFVVRAIGHQSTICCCNMSRSTWQETHLRIHPHSLDYWSSHHPTTDGTPPLPVGHPQTSQVPKGKNHMRQTVSNTGTGSDLQNHPQHLLHDILPPHQPSPMDGDRYVVPLSDPLPPGPIVKQIVLGEIVLMRGIPIHRQSSTYPKGAHALPMKLPGSADRLHIPCVQPDL
jgi:hypothetical protein